MKIALTIAGSDSSGGAGLQADLKTFAALGCYGASVVTAVTAQNTRAVDAVQFLPASVIAAQLDTVLADLRVGVIKTGMLASAEVATVVSKRLASYGPCPLVVDPVLRASTGSELGGRDLAQAIVEHILPLCTLLTPNADEAAQLLGASVGSVRKASDAMQAARALGALGSKAVLVKGGHLDHEVDAVDVLWDGQKMHTLRSPRLAAVHTHGTGCTYASAIAAKLLQGKPLRDAVAHARTYMQGAIAQGLALGSGSGPTDHFWFMGPLADGRGWQGKATPWE